MHAARGAHTTSTLTLVLAEANSVVAGSRYAGSWSGSSEGYSDTASSVTQIVGMSCAYPGRADPAAYGPMATLSPSPLTPAAISGGGAGAFLATALWGDDLPRLIPAERWDMEAAYAPDVAIHHTYVRHAGFLAGVDRFDADAFRWDIGMRDNMPSHQCICLIGSVCVSELRSALQTPLLAI